MNSVKAHDSRRGMFLVMIATTLWGTVGVSTRLISQLAYTNWLSLALLRTVIATPVLLFIGQRTLGKKMWAIPRRDLALIVLIGIFSAVSQAFYFAAIPYTGISIATLLAICITPVVVTIINAILERRLPDNMTLFSVVLALVGTSLLVLGGQATSIQSVSLIGVMYGIGAAVTYAGVVLVGRFVSDRYHPVQVTGIAFGAGSVLLLIIGLFVGYAVSYPVLGWLLLLYVGLVPTALGYALFMMGISTTPAPIASVVSMFEPLTATILAWVMFNERLSIVSIGGAVMLLVSIYLLSTKETRVAIVPEG